MNMSSYTKLCMEKFLRDINLKFKLKTVSGFKGLIPK